MTKKVDWFPSRGKSQFSLKISALKIGLNWCPTHLIYQEMTWSYKETTFDNCKLGWVIPINLHLPLLGRVSQPFSYVKHSLFGKTRGCLKTSNISHFLGEFETSSCFTAVEIMVKPSSKTSQVPPCCGPPQKHPRGFQGEISLRKSRGEQKNPVKAIYRAISRWWIHFFVNFPLKKNDRPSARERLGGLGVFVHRKSGNWAWEGKGKGW